MTMISAAELLRTARRAAGLTQAQLARELGATQGAVARLERRGSNPTIATLARALQATGHRLELGVSARRPSVDDTLIAQRLRLTPADRLRTFQASHRKLARFGGAAKRGHGPQS
jgi:transcriptional regulator with XRE-family HTH domain